MTEATTVYSGRMTNWPLIGVGVAAFVALIILGRPWAGPWPGMLVPLAVALVLALASLVTSTSLRVTTRPRRDHRCAWSACPVPCHRWQHSSSPRGRIAAVDIVTVTPWKSWDYGL